MKRQLRACRGARSAARKQRAQPARKHSIHLDDHSKAESSNQSGRLIELRVVEQQELEFYVAEGATSHAFWQSVPADRLKSLISDLTELSDADAVEEDFIDLGQSIAFEVQTSEGECAS